VDAGGRPGVKPIVVFMGEPSGGDRRRGLVASDVPDLFFGLEV